MSLKYYPNRIQNGQIPVIDQLMARRNPQLATGSQDITVTALDYELSATNNWQINSISLIFSNANARDYSAAVKNGKTVVADVNDALYFQTSNSSIQRIVLDPGFYDDVTLPVELKAQLDANAQFSSLGRTFTVTYTAATGLFAITPSSGQIRYFQQNLSVAAPRLVESIGGHMIGLTANTNFAANVTSDTAVYAMGSEAFIITATAAVVLTHYNDDLHTMTVDQALHLETSAAAQTVTYAIDYEELI